MQEKKFIDISQILADKAPGLKRWLPGFMLNWLKRKLHEDDINKIMHALRDDRELEFNTKGLEKLGVKVETINAHNLPTTGGIIVAANHPLGGLDGYGPREISGRYKAQCPFFCE